MGSHKATGYGREAAQRISYDLAAAGVGIISGLAHGIDTAAHRAALDAGGYTTAVMASGLDTIYPARNRELAGSIVNAGGAILSEHTNGTPPLRQQFPARNRIIAGLCMGAIIIEAAERSGALITARFALEENRDVMAIPGNITNPLSKGANNLIKAGAALVTNADDVLETMGLPPRETDPIVKTATNTLEENRILELLKQGVVDTDALIHTTEWDAAMFNRVITTMEASGAVRRARQIMDGSISKTGKNKIQ